MSAPAAAPSRPEDLPGQHGTYLMYRAERRQFGKSCDECRRANTEMVKLYRRARGAAPRRTRAQGGSTGSTGSSGTAESA